MGGSRDVFWTTCWTEIFDARTLDEARRREAMEDILTRYWRPVYCYLRRKGHGNEKAKDLTQGFFQEVLLERELVQKADRAKGRFRTFLLTALDRYAADVYRAETAQKRGGKIRFEGMDSLDVPEPNNRATPAEAFDYAWASALMDQVLADVRQECEKRGMPGHWGLFREKVLQPIVDGTEALSYEELCAKYQIDRERTARNMVITVRRWLQAAFRRHLRPLVSSDDEVEREIDDLVHILSRSSAAS